MSTKAIAQVTLENLDPILSHLTTLLNRREAWQAVRTFREARHEMSVMDEGAFIQSELSIREADCVLSGTTREILHLLASTDWQDAHAGLGALADARPE